MPKVKICDPSALGKGKSSIKPQTSIKPQMNTRKKKQLEDKIIELFGICLTFAEVKKVIGLQDYTCAMNWIRSEGIDPVLVNGRKRYLAADVAKALELSKIRVV